jgi:hypothetical protein
LPTILLTGGRAPATLDLARLLHAAGHTVLVAESLPRHLCQASRAVARCFDVPPPNPDHAGFIDALGSIIRVMGVKLLIPTCEEVFHVARGAARLPCEVFAPPIDQLRRLHSKWEFIQGLTVAKPRTWLLHELAERPPGKLVLKPEFSRFSVHVRVLEADQPLPELKGRWVVQEFIEGRPLCTYGVARDGRLLAHAAYAPDFTAGAGAAIHFVPLAHPALQAWVQDFVAAEHLTGQVAFDFIEAPDGTLYPLECNPRATSGLHLFADADRLDRAFCEEHPQLITPRPTARAQLALAMWVYGLAPAAQSGPKRLFEWARALGAAQDVVFRWDDPGPAMEQWLVFAELERRARAAGTTALEASTADIEWNGEL